jgi:hypothetical protein
MSKNEKDFKHVCVSVTGRKIVMCLTGDLKEGERKRERRMGERKREEDRRRGREREREEDRERER